MSDTSAPRYNVRFGLPDDFSEFLTRVRFSEVKGDEEPVYLQIGDQEIITYHPTQINDLLSRLRAKGWSIRSLANAFGNSYTRTIENRLENAESESLAKYEYDPIKWEGGDLPEPPGPDDDNYHRANAYDIPPNVAQQMKLLQPIAKQNRRGFSDDSAPRVAARELGRLMHQEHKNGATIKQIAEAMNVEYITARLRMQRYNLLDDEKDFPSYEEKRVEDLKGNIENGQ